MPTPEEKQSLNAKCVELGRNDPCITSLDLRKYGKLEWDDTSHITGSLANNTRVRELILSLNGRHLSSDGMDPSVPLLPFLSSSPSLKSLVVTRDSTAPDIRYSHSTVYILQALSHNKLLVKLDLRSLVYAKPSLIEELLAKTPTLEELNVTEGERSDSEVYHAFRRGLEQNNSLKSLDWVSRGPSPDLGEVFFGLSNHLKLKTLRLSVQLNRASSQALRSYLHANETLDQLSLRLKAPSEATEGEYSTLTPILLGLACNRGVKRFDIRSSPLSLLSCATTAWVELLQKNTSIKIMEFKKCCIGRDDMSAIARGLEGNASLEKLNFIDLSKGGSILHGPAWQAMLQRNRSLKEIVLSHDLRSSGEISSDDFACFAEGLVQNTSLKSLDLGNISIGNAGIAAFVEALEGNYTLESLVLNFGKIKGVEGAAAVQNLWRNKTLKHLDLSSNFYEEGEAPTGFPADLSRNCIFETLNLRGVGLQSHQCRAICESLQENSCLRVLDLSNNDIYLDAECATALNDLLGSTTLRVLDFSVNRGVANEGIGLLACGLQGNSSLRELNLQRCEIGNEGLLNLGEALVENSTLEILRLRDDFGQDGVVKFFQLLPQMEGLMALCIASDDMVSEEFWVAVVDGLRKNTGLQRLTCEANGITWHEGAPPHVKPLIELYLNLNRNGRKWLEAPLASRVPVGLWPLILANMSSPKDTSLLYYFLRKKPSLVVE
jgi:Ran GTPase-activating protein (RanGAP) involved in mRNA processing and transport